MEKAMDRVGESLRAKFYWVEDDDPIYLVMDNAGGHGTDECVKKYTDRLKKKHKVQIIHQVPRSPYTNLLDLGVWCSLQSQVEKEHYMKRTDLNALAKSVDNAWKNDATIKEMIGKVWSRLRNVLFNIREDKGGNNLVETKRGKKHRNIQMPQEFLLGN